jgi:putrescine transport system substrate-binding protein
VKNFPLIAAMVEIQRRIGAGKGALIVAVVIALALGIAPARSAAQQRFVNVYNWSEYLDPAVLDEFTAATGIKVRYDTFESSDTLDAKLLAGNSGYDVVVPTGYYLPHEIAAGIFQKLDKSKLPNLVNVWPEIARRMAVYDPGNQYAVNYMWGTTGIGFNVSAVKKILGPNATIDSWDDVFVPDKIARFKDCGIYLLDSSDDVLPAALNYLHLDPSSRNPQDLEQAAELVTKIRPYVRKFDVSEYLNALATGEICFVVGFSGDIKQAQKRAAEAKSGIQVGYSIPKEGAQLWFDNLAIPSDAPDVAEAHKFINFLLRPDIAAQNTNFVTYANGNLASQQFIKKSILNDRTIYPDAATMQRLYAISAHDEETERLMNRLWMRVKTGM